MSFCLVCTLPKSKLNLERTVQVLYRLEDFEVLTQRTLDGKIPVSVKKWHKINVFKEHICL